ncbi:MAG TPA: ribosome recycling factor [Patescibacteria group bacterium]|nr:ribosome recycling factor [Patescibacteria group bacterium]
MDPLAQETKKRIEKILEVLRGDLATIRTGRATPSLVEGVVINAYGGTARLKVMELATIGATDTKTLVITPFDPSIIHEIQKGIESANVGFTPIIDGNIIRISIPPLSQERREELIKAMKHKLENGKIMVRQARHESMEDIKKEYEGREDDIKRLEKEVQKLVDDTMTTIEDYGKQKEQELMQI